MQVVPSLRSVVRVVGVLGPLVLAAAMTRCSSGTLAGTDGSSNPDAASDARGDRALDGSITDGSGGDTACATIQGHADIVRRPLDVIVIVDSTGTFDQPRMAIEGVLAPELIDQLEREMIDYRVVVVGAPITPPPATTPPRYFYVMRSVGSSQLLGNLPGHLRAALPNLRTDSLKAVIDFSDTADATIGTRADFYAGMAAPDLVAVFGDSMSRRYNFHAVMGVANNTPSSMPWTPMDPVVTTLCTGFTTRPGPELQLLAIENGGYRFPLCDLAEYGAFFDAVARQAISAVQVPCEYTQPTAADGSTPDIMYAQLTTDSMGTMQTFHSVSGMSACGDGFYLVPGAGGTDNRIVLCPSTCRTVQSDPHATVTFSFLCPPA